MLMLIAVFHVTLSPAFYSCPSKSKVIWAFACKQVKWTGVFEEKHLKCIGCTCSLIVNVWTYIGIHWNYLCNAKSPETIMIGCKKLNYETLFFLFLPLSITGWLVNYRMQTLLRSFYFVERFPKTVVTRWLVVASWVCINKETVDLEPWLTVAISDSSVSLPLSC